MEWIQADLRFEYELFSVITQEDPVATGSSVSSIFYFLYVLQANNLVLTNVDHSASDASVDADKRHTGILPAGTVTRSILLTAIQWYSGSSHPNALRFDVTGRLSKTVGSLKLCFTIIVFVSWVFSASTDVLSVYESVDD